MEKLTNNVYTETKTEAVTKYCLDSEGSVFIDTAQQYPLLECGNLPKTRPD